MTRLMVLNSHDLWQGEMCPVRAAGLNIVLIRLRSGVVAYEDRCPHLGVPLSRGVLDGDVLTCSAHHYTYDVTTGCGLNPCNVALTPVAVAEEGDHIFLDVKLVDQGSADRGVDVGARR